MITHRFVARFLLLVQRSGETKIAAARLTNRQLFMSATTPTEKQRELGERWAESYDCWVNAPGSTHTPIYTRPQKNNTTTTTYDDDWGTNEWPRAVRELSLPIFGLTAANPRGEDWPDDRNRQANALLQQELEVLSNTAGSSSGNAPCCCWWNGLGFGETWQEKGFIVSCERSKVLELATKYQQGAVYEFVFTEEEEAVVLRRTVPVLVPNVEADVRIVTCPRPPFATSDPEYEATY